jgi:flagellar hook capping protein FlgD
LQRVLSTVTLLGLLVATAAAFAITEHLKLIRNPISGATVTSSFSPVCGCATARAEIRIKLRHANRVTVTIEDSARRTVATLATGVHEPKGYVTFYWDGRTGSGTVVSSGVYRAQVKLSRRTILLPNKIAVDTTPPAVLSATDGNGLLVPLGAKHAIAIDYTLSEDAHPAVYLGGTRIILGQHTRHRGALKWNGLHDGTPLPAGRQVLEIGAVDLAGNATPPSARKRVVVDLRDIALGAQQVRVRAGARFSIRVQSTAATYTWRLAGRSGTSHGKVLRLRAPSKRGTYTLTVVGSHGARATATLNVRAR